MRNFVIAASMAALALISLSTGPTSSAERNFTPVVFNQDHAPIGDKLMTASQRSKKAPAYAQAVCSQTGAPACANGQYCCHFNQLDTYGCCQDVAHCCSDGCCQ
jgi:hypothetical protein